MVSNRKLKRQREKAEKKFSRMAKKGKLRRHQKEKLKEVYNRRKAKSQQRMAQIQQDWLLDRQQRKRERERLSENSSDEEEEDALPLDMLDPELGSMDAAFYKQKISANEKPRNGNNEDDDDEEMDEEEWAEQVRTFVSEEELLPIKVDGKLIKRVRQMEAEWEKEMMEEGKPQIEDIKEEVEEEEDGQDQEPPPDLSTFTEEQFAEHYAKLLAQTESTLALAADQIMVDPRENVSKFGPMLKMAAGEGIPTLVREATQKLAIASLVELFVNVLPGYPVHVLTEAEKTQKMKKETKRLAAFEQSLLNYYTKYLKILEKNATKLIDKKPDESTFAAQLGFLCTRCLCRLAESCTHFNYAPSIVTCLVRLSLSKWDKIVDAVCTTLSNVFAADVHLKISLHGVKAIATLVDKKKAYVSAQLVGTLLALNIKEIERKKAASKKKNVQQSRKKHKFDKQIGKLEAELEEAIAADSHTAKLRLATEVMRHVFVTYFRILRRMPQTALLRPVLEGLSRHVQLINVEFYPDLIDHLGKLVEQKQLKLSETLHCVRTASYILTGEGQAIDVDLQKFYKALYAAMPSICFQPENAQQEHISLLVEAMDLLLLRRRKTMSPAKAAAFAKRLALMAIPLRSRPMIALLLMLRRLFTAHSGLKSLIEPDDGEDFLVVAGQFRPDCADPEHANSLSSSLRQELQLFTTHPNPLVRNLGHHLLNGQPATGKHRLEARWTNLDPNEIFKLDDPLLNDGEAQPFFLESIKKFNKKKTLCSETICSTLCNYLDNSRK